MRLPVPNGAEVDEFRELYRREFGIELAPEDALDLAIRTVQLFYIKNYAVHPLCQEEQRE